MVKVAKAVAPVLVAQAVKNNFLTRTAMTDAALKLHVQEAMKTALKAQQKERLSVLRMMFSEIKQREIDTRVSLSDTEIQQAFSKMIKSRRDAIEQYQAGNRQDLVDKENFEITVIQEFLPQALSEAEISTLIQQAMQETQASTAKDMGKIMQWLKPHIQGRADGTVVARLVKEKLA